MIDAFVFCTGKNQDTPPTSQLEKLCYSQTDSTSICENQPALLTADNGRKRFATVLCFFLDERTPRHKYSLARSLFSIYLRNRHGVGESNVFEQPQPFFTRKQRVVRSEI